MIWSYMSVTGGGRRGGRGRHGGMFKKLEENIYLTDKYEKHKSMRKKKSEQAVDQCSLLPDRVISGFLHCYPLPGELYLQIHMRHFLPLHTEEIFKKKMPLRLIPNPTHF